MSLFATIKRRLFPEPTEEQKDHLDKDYLDDTMKKAKQLEYQLRSYGVHAHISASETWDDYTERLEDMLHKTVAHAELKERQEREIRQKWLASWTDTNKSSGVLPPPTTFRAPYESQFSEEVVSKEMHVSRYELEEYVQMVQQNPLVHKVSVLYDDRPDEVSLRVEYIDNLSRLDSDILREANEELTKVTTYLRIQNCKRIEVTYVQKEVIE